MSIRVIALSLLLIPAAQASDINPLDLAQLTPQSEFVVVGVVTAITATDASSDTIVVRMLSVIKGKTDEKTFTLRVENKGVRNFDPILAIGDQGIFFLKTLENGKSTLTFPGSIAIMSKQGNFTTSK